MKHFMQKAAAFGMAVILAATPVLAEELDLDAYRSDMTPIGDLSDNSSAETYEERHAIDVALTSHKFTGEIPTKIPENLKEPDARGGTVLRMPGNELWKPGLDWELFSTRTPPVSEMQFVDQGGGEGYYDFIVKDESRGQGFWFGEQNTVPIKPNRKYILSMLVWIDFTRIPGRAPIEMTMAVRMFNNDNKVVLSTRHGLPDYTGGWTRLEFESSPGLMEAATKATFLLNTYNVAADGANARFAIADICLIECPEVEPREAFAEGEGVTFRGSAGSMDMKVVNATEDENQVRVETSGVVYHFDKKNNKITASQKIGLKRDVAVWDVGTDLSTLSIKSTTEKECVVTNPEVTFGVQMDSILFMTPHKENVSMTATSKISGIWNRFHWGHLTVVDGYGGFTVTPDISMGSGLASDCEVLTENLDFTSYVFQNQLKFDDDGSPYDVNNLVSNCKPGFQIKWNVRPGERLAISTFPPKEYEWERSFASKTEMRTFDSTYFGDLESVWRDEWQLDYGSLWKFSDHSYANEYQDRHTFSQYDNRVIQSVNELAKVGLGTIMYITSYFTKTTTTPEPYINEVKRIRDTYGIDGVYSDGTPSEFRWVSAYEVVRMLRELFPDGYVEVHQSGVHENGGAPLSSPSYFIPGLDAYLTTVFKGETIGIEGLNPALVALASSQNNVSNSVGMFKGDAWYWEDGEGKRTVLPRAHHNILCLEWNMRGKNAGGVDVWTNQYLPIENALEELWKEKGDDPEFYDKYYAPKARELIRDVAAIYGDYTELSDGFDEMPDAKLYGVHDTTADIAADGDNKALRLSGSYGKNGSVIKRFSPIGGPLSVSYRFRVDERGDFAHSFSSVTGAPPISLKFSRDGRITLRNVKGGTVSVGRYQKGQWIEVSLDINTDKHSFDVILNGKKVLHNMQLADNLYNISQMEFTDGGTGAVCRIDDLKVINKYE